MTEPTNRSHLIDYKYVLGLVIAGLAFYWTQRADDDRRITATETKQATVPDMRNRELDDLRERLLSLENYVREHCGKG